MGEKKRTIPATRIIFSFNTRNRIPKSFSVNEWAIRTISLSRIGHKTKMGLEMLVDRPSVITASTVNLLILVIARLRLVSLYLRSLAFDRIPHHPRPLL